jgi:type IV pilus assembly protein PilC
MLKYQKTVKLQQKPSTQLEENIKVGKKENPPKANKQKTDPSKMSFSFRLINRIAVSGKQKKELFENLTLMITSGVDMLSALNSLEMESKSRFMKKIIESMRGDIENGAKFWTVVEKYGLVPPIFIPIVKIGEESGKLDQNLQIIIDYIQKEEDFRSKLRSASVYPLFVMGVLLVVGSGVGLFILPNLAATYSNLKIDLPWITKVFIDVGKFLGTYGFYAVPAFFAIVFFIVYFVFIFKKTKFIGQAIMFRAPGIGKLIKEVEISRFGYLLGTLLGAGVPILRSIELLKEATGYKVYANIYAKLIPEIEGGRTFEQGFQTVGSARKYISTYSRQLIIASERTGKMPEALLKIGQVYTRRSEYSSKNLSVIIEPLLLIFVWLGVAVMSFAVVLPIYTLTSSLSSEGTTYTNTNTGQTTTTRTLKGKTAEEIAQIQVDNSSTYNPLSDVKIGTTGDGYLNVRSAVQGSVIDQININQTFTILDENSGWYKIQLANGKTGWVNGSLIVINN